MNLSTPEASEPIRLGLLLTAVQVAVFLAFILTCCFNVPLLRQDFGTGIPLSFVFGFGVAACGVALTALYVVVANRSDKDPV